MSLCGQVVDILTRPQRFCYHPNLLGPRNFPLQSAKTQQTINVHRRDTTLRSGLEHSIELSLFSVGTGGGRCVVYLHANNGSRVEALQYVPVVLEQHVSFCAFDFEGSGISSGKFVTLGVKEATNISQVVEYLVKQGMSEIYLWGRSMGAVAALIYASQAHKEVKSIVLDSPFSDLEQLITESGSKHTGLPRCCFQPCIPCIDSALHQRIGVNLQAYCLEEYLSSPAFKNIPGLFLVSKADGMIDAHHGQSLYQNYLCPSKELAYIEEAHGGKRSIKTVNRIMDFMFRCGVCGEETISISAMLSDSRCTMDNFKPEGSPQKISLTTILREYCKSSCN